MKSIHKIVKMKLEHKKEIEIRNFETDVNGNCSLPVIFDYFQGIAEEHAASLGFGYDDMLKSKQVWVLSRMMIHINKIPRIGEKLHLSTWPKRTDRLFALRDYEIQSNREILVSSGSAWIIIDMDSRKPIKPDGVFSHFNDLKQYDAVKETPGKVTIPNEFSHKMERTVRFTDIDINKHMNNGHYSRWILDIIPQDVVFNKTTSSFLINYTSELLFGDIVTVKAKQTSDNKWTVWGEKDNKTAFAGKLEWQ